MIAEGFYFYLGPFCNRPSMYRIY